MTSTSRILMPPLKLEASGYVCIGTPSHRASCSICRRSRKPAPLRCQSELILRTTSVREAALCRRRLLQMAMSIGLSLSYSHLPSATAQELSQAAEVKAGPSHLQVGSDCAYQTISQALSSAKDDDVILVAAGMYKERLVIQKRVTITAVENSSVTVSWQTTRPYESVVECKGAIGAVIRDLNIRHRSPSVANNYAVFIQGSDLVMENCNVSSATGSGIGIEGGDPLISNTLVRDCARHGVAIFTELGGSEGGGTVRDCYLNANKGDGLLVRDGAAPAVTSCIISANNGYGASLKGCGGVYRDNSFGNNGKGSILLDMLAEVSMLDLCTSNRLDKLPTVV